MIYIILLPVFVVVMLFYFRVANYYNIIDRPNERSSHSTVTIRGGGIIYLVAALFAVFMEQAYWLSIVGLLLIGLISFLDDRMTISSKLRILIHLIAVTFLFISLGLFQMFSWPLILGFYILVIGIINAYNFMDGINGITGSYSLVILLGLLYINTCQIAFIQVNLIIIPILASLVFLFFNFRKTAKCFAGDVGSVALAFWIIWLLLTLMLNTGNYIYILFLGVYGVDSILTIIHRLMRKENIFLAHRLHFYQILANEQKIPHLIVSSMYTVIQALIITLVIFSNLNWIILSLISLLPMILIYIILKPRLMIHVKK
ncbi:MAG: glycosyltransferase family 4 protein [Bacteroidota bacterium]